MAERQIIKIAIDAMGGDSAPDMVIEGASRALKMHQDIEFMLFGDQAKINPLLEKYPNLKGRCELIHTKDYVRNEDKPTVALRNRTSSMRMAVDSVRDKKTDCVVSAGNTGAYMAMAKVFLKTTDGVSRPAIAGTFPTKKGTSVVMDLGANVSCDADNLVEFAVMGKIYAREVIGVDNPSIGLLNIGEEEMKGNANVQGAAQILRRAKKTINFYGFVEGDDLFKGTTDVIITDGFTGNAALKSAEGFARFMTDLLKEAFKENWLTKLGYLLLRGPMEAVKQRLNPKVHNGAILIGLGGIAIKSHGGADGESFSYAINVARNMVSHNLNKQISETLQKLHEEVVEIQE